MNRITIKFGTELKPTKHIVVNHNFTNLNSISSLATKMSLAFYCYPMLNSMDMILGHSPVIPLINVRIYACDYAIVNGSNIIVLIMVKVLQVVTLRHYC